MFGHPKFIQNGKKATNPNLVIDLFVTCDRIERICKICQCNSLRHRVRVTHTLLCIHVRCKAYSHFYFCWYSVWWYGWCVCVLMLLCVLNASMLSRHKFSPSSDKIFVHFVGVKNKIKSPRHNIYISIHIVNWWLIN